MKKLLFVLHIAVTVITSSCNTKEKEWTATSNIIPMEKAVRNERIVKLSEIVDRVDLILLETLEDCQLRDTYWYTQTPPYICVSGHLFDYSGKHRYEIGSKGLGPGEDFYKPIEVLYHPKLNKFLSQGSKLIIYNEDGQYSGIERSLFKLDTQGEEGGPIVSGSDNLKEKAVAGSNFVFSNKYDSLLWMDENLQTIKQIPIPKSGTVSSFLDDDIRYYRLFTTNDSTLFYNYWNDTIYRVLSDRIEPRWIVDLGKEKAPDEVRLHSDELKEELFQACLGGRYGKQAEWNDLDGIRLTKGKKAIWAVYETTDYLFFIWSPISPRNFHRNITDFYLQVAYYNKKTGETVAVKGKGFEDDILGTGSYIPLYGVFKNNLMKVVWPFELREFIEKKQKRGHKIDPRLLDLNKKLNDEDNPILLVAHLKES